MELGASYLLNCGQFHSFCPMSPGLPPGLSAQMPCPQVLVTLEAPGVAAPGGYVTRGHRAACERAGGGLPAGETYTVAKALTEGGCFSHGTHVYAHTHTERTG